MHWIKKKNTKVKIDLLSYMESDYHICTVYPISSPRKEEVPLCQGHKGRAPGNLFFIIFI